ncbi:MAG: CHAP domain-containing protein [Weeksellaceae bacterium]
MENQKSKVNKETNKHFLFIVLMVFFVAYFTATPKNTFAQDTQVNRCRFRFDTLIDILLNRDSECYDAPNINSGGTIGGQPAGSPAPSGPAPTANPFPSVSPPPGNLPPSNTISERAVELTNRIKEECGPTVDGGDILTGCLNDLDDIYGWGTIFEISSCPVRSGSYWLQCVCYARALAKATGRPYEGFGNAKEHIGKSVAGYRYTDKVGNVPTPGDIALWDSGPWGHIALIAEVNRNYAGQNCNYNMRIVEANYGQNGLVRHDRILYCDEPDFKGWQRRI